MTNESDKQEVQDLNLEEIKKNKWEDLLDIYQTTLDEIQKQLALVYEFKLQAKDKLDEETSDAFDGLIKSFQDLLKETFEISVLHAVETTVVEKSNDKITVPTKLKAGPLENDDDALEYINIASKYFNIQDKVLFLISTGWTDLFVKLKLDTEELDKTLIEANTLFEKITQDEGEENGQPTKQ